MKVLLDTNIIVDVLSKRDGYKDSLQVLRCCEINKIEGYISTTTVTDIMYIMRKHLPPEKLREAMQTLFTTVDVTGVQKADITQAFSSRIKDFEDAVQAACAKRIKTEFIITRNMRDFEHSPVKAISPPDLLKILDV